MIQTHFFSDFNNTSRLSLRQYFNRVKILGFFFFLSCFISFLCYADNSNLAFSETINSSVETSSPLLIDRSAVKLLNKMKASVLDNDYKLYFIVQDEDEYPNSYQYTYVGSKINKKGALLSLEGSAKEIILNDNIVSYFLIDSASFSIAANRIIEVFPDVIYSDFDSLIPNYDFINLGKGRVANRSCQLIRIISKDKDRYSYVIWIDDENFLPLRIDLLDLNSKIINQKKVLVVDFDFNKQKFEYYIADRVYPILYPIDKEDSDRKDWQVTWLPKGFKRIDTYNINFQESNIDTQHFTDGIFSFTINVSKRTQYDKVNLSIQGDRSIYSYNQGNLNIIIIGNLPAETIKQIAYHLKFK